MSDTPQVTQSKLNIAHNEVAEVSPGELQPHPKNAEIYGDTDDATDLGDEFVESVKSKGVLEPLTVTNDGQIVSGHRRWVAAKQAELATVPVRRESFESDLHEREAIIEFNRQREKTPGQIVNEFEEMLAIEEERSPERQGERTDLDEHRGNVSTKSDGFGKARDKAAEKVNADVSGRTLEKGKTVKDKAESDDEPEEVQEAAREAWDGLRSGEESFNGAYSKVKEAEKETKEDNGPSDMDVLTSNKTDEWSSPRELVEPIADTIGGFDLDPCSGAESSPFADATYTESDNGLAQSWHGSVWVNPPYSAMSKWTEKVVSESSHDAVDSILYLCKGDSSTDWWQEAVTSAEYVVTIDHRLKFGDGDNSAPFASHIFVFGEVSDRVIEKLKQFGCVLQPLTRGDSHE